MDYCHGDICVVTILVLHIVLVVILVFIWCLSSLLMFYVRFCCSGANFCIFCEEMVFFLCKYFTESVCLQVVIKQWSLTMKQDARLQKGQSFALTIVASLEGLPP